MKINELKASIKTVTLMLEEINDNLEEFPPEVTNQALLQTSSYINNIIFQNEGFQLELFNEDFEIT